MIEQKGITFAIPSPFLLPSFRREEKGGREKGKRITKVFVKSHTFLLDHQYLKNVKCQQRNEAKRERTTTLGGTNKKDVHL